MIIHTKTKNTFFKKNLVAFAFVILSTLMVASTIGYVQSLPFQYVSSNTNGLMDACLQSGFSVSYCNNILFSTNPGGYCTTLQYANVPCPQIQDPDYTYSDPGNAIQDSQNKINQLDNLIRQWDSLYPPGSLGGQ